MKQLFYFFLICNIASMRYATAQSIDPRLKKITPQEVHHLIATTPLDGVNHTRIQSRAARWGFSQIAYQDYLKIQRQNTQNVYANLLLGFAARARANDVPLDTQTANFRKLLAQEKSFREIQRRSLQRAYELRPDLALTNLAYGFQLWQYDNQMGKGLGLMQKALEIDPKDVRIYATLGDVYGNSSGNAYDPKRSEDCLLTAIRMDSTYAIPHWTLACLYVNTKRYREANVQLNKYLQLTPTGTANQAPIKAVAAEIQNHLT